MSEKSTASMYATNVTFENDSFVDDLEKFLCAIAQERNDLIHKKLLSLDLKSSGSCQALVNELKAQEQRIEPQFKDLATILVALQEAHARRSGTIDIQ